MSTKSFLVVSVISLAAISLLQGQSPAPAESPAGSPTKHRTHKKAEAAESPAAATEASPSPAAKRGRKAKTTAASAAMSPSPTPAKKTLADFFKPQTSASAPPAAANAAPAKATRTGAAMNATPAPGGGHGLVWVNTDSHVYHKEGSRFYGKTKKGKYVSEADALKEGDKASKE